MIKDTLLIHQSFFSSIIYTGRHELDVGVSFSITRQPTQSIPYLFIFLPLSDSLSFSLSYPLSPDIVILKIRWPISLPS